MATYSGTRTADELSGATPTSGGWRVRPGEIAYAAVRGSADLDNYTALLEDSGYYRFVASNDRSNAPDGSTVWGTPEAGLLLTQYQKGYWATVAIAQSLIPGNGDGCIIFYVEVPPHLSSSANFSVEGRGPESSTYVVKLERLDYLAGTGTAAATGVLHGTDGSDWITGGDRNDAIDGGAGNDVVAGGRGNDVIDGGTGRDTLYFPQATQGVTVDLTRGTSVGQDSDVLISIEALFATKFADRLTGSAEVDYFYADDGDDQIWSLGGDDRIEAGSGSDLVDGGEGSDTVVYDIDRLSATISFDASTGEIVVATDHDGNDRLKAVEWIEFTDGKFDTTLLIDRTPPSILSTTPANGANEVPVTSDIVINFSESVHAGNGHIVVRDASGKAVADFNIGSSPRVSISGSILTIDLPENLQGATAYVVDLDPGVVADDAGNAFAGGRGLGFATQPPPLQVSIGDAVATEGQGGLTFAITLSRGISADYTVVVSTVADLTATAGVDFTPMNARTINIPAGQTQTSITIPVLDDLDFEAEESVHVRLSAPSTGIIGDVDGRGVIRDNDAGARVLPAEPLLTRQWYLYPGSGVDALSVWPQYTGLGIRVAVFDQGIDPTQPDLAQALDSSGSWNTATGTRSSGAPALVSDNHGTAVAGLIAAQANGQGLLGVAYAARLTSLYSPLNGSSPVGSIVNAFTEARSADVLNNSWGYAPAYFTSAPWAFYDNFIKGEFTAAGVALEELARLGRMGLGTIVVQSAGNSFAFGDDTNLHNFQNSRYVVTVGATDYHGKSAFYSTPGASILVCAPGGEGPDPSTSILTTDRSGRAGYEDSDTVNVTGTSFAAPLVAGVIALMLEANPTLGWRDIQTLLAYSAHQTDTAGNQWNRNAGTGWNGGGLHFDAQTHDLGFGLLNAHDAVRLAETWTQTAKTSANAVHATASLAKLEAVPDGNGSVIQTVTVERNISVERAEVRLLLQHAAVSDLTLVLTSPGGTQSWLLNRPGSNGPDVFGPGIQGIDFEFSTVLVQGEASAGRWSLQAFDAVTGAVGQIKSWTLTLYGSTPDADDTHVYTDEFQEMAGGDPSRRVLTDLEGTDTLNAAAVTSNSMLSLLPGTISRIDGQEFSISPTTVIENAVGGDGNDELVGNSAHNRLEGGRGNDRLAGGPGDDTMIGGPGFDVAAFNGNRRDHLVTITDAAVEVRSGSGTDRLVGMERLMFADSSLALDTGRNDHAGQAAQIVRALFGGGYLAVKEFVGAGVGLLDSGLGYLEVVTLAISTSEFVQRAGSRSNADFVKLVYTNVVGFEPGAEDLAHYTELLDSGAHTQVSLALLACQISFNVDSPDLVGLMTTGIDYVVPAWVTGGG